METVEDFLGIPIDYYATVDLTGLKMSSMKSAESMSMCRLTLAKKRCLQIEENLF
ncbi:hypothetical protein PO124_31980 [Bacillus licheniformis]|nr:hypothetical protein [Bacillus licheniformis]